MITCKIISPQKTLFSGEVESITLPSFDGEAQVLENHAESFFILRNGKIILWLKNGRKEISIKKGIFHILDNRAIMLVS